jgi:hypothetical protein
MPIEIQYEPNDIYVLRISGVLKRSEFAAEQNALARKIYTGSKPRLLVSQHNLIPPNVQKTSDSKHNQRCKQRTV